MELDEFIRQEYITLREEIKETKARLFKIMGFGIIALPSGQYVAAMYKVIVLIYILPLLIIVIALAYLAENHALMRCGNYIRFNIEDKVQGMIGWESWIETSDQKNNKRIVDQYRKASFYILFAVYYVISVSLAMTAIDEQFGLIAMIIGTALYVAIGVWFLTFLLKNIKCSSSTRC